MSRNSRTRRIRILGVLLLIIFGSVATIYAYQRLNPSPSGLPPSSSAPSCAAPLGKATVLRTQLHAPTVIGGITEFALPSPLRDPNAPVVAQDGSVWFGEQAVAGVAHFYPNNRTLVEYAWPFSYATPPNTDQICGNKSDIWGIALWDGKVWASDTTGNQLVALDPTNGQFSTVKFATNSSYPYTLTQGPNDTLWVTELFTSKIAELSSNGTLREYALPGGANQNPTQIVFVNSTTGFYDDVGEGGEANGGIYSFKVDHFAPTLVGGRNLSEPSSITLASGAVWVALHGSSSVGEYNFTTKSWSFYPTSYVTWDGNAVTTLPYFVQANGSDVWVNEHYGNRMAVIEPANGSLVEYSESNHPIDGNTIVTATTFALGNGRAWFTEWTADGLGYVDSSYNPGFYTSILGNNSVVVGEGSSNTVNLVVHDTTHQGSLNLTFSDSEAFASKPSNLTFSVPSTSMSVLPGGETTVTVTITALPSLKPGTYWATLTATDGLTYESSFLQVVVGQRQGTYPAG